MDPDDDFFRVTKHLHNLLQGARGRFTASERATYLCHNDRLYADLELLHPDVWVLHDPQPAAAGARLDGGVPKVWHSHIDTSGPNRAAMRFLEPHVQRYDAVILSRREYGFPSISEEGTYVMEPAIDPLAPRILVCARGESSRSCRVWGLISPVR
jgi:trehalose synthase